MFSLPIRSSIVLALVLVLPMVCIAQKANNGEIPVTTVSEEAKVNFLKARDAFDMGKFEGARVMLDEAIEKDPDFAMAYLYKAYSATSAADWRKNIDKAVANKDATSKGEQLLIDIDMTLLNNDAEKRFELAKQLAAEYPSSQRALLMLAEQHQQRKEYTMARDLMYSAMQIDSDFSLSHRELALSYLFDEPKEFSVAEKYMKKFVQLRPKEAISYVGLGDVYRAQSRMMKARDAYAQAIEIDPESYVAYAKKGHPNTFLGNYEEARVDYLKAQEIAKDYSKAQWANFGTFTYLYAGDVKSALDANEKLIRNIENMGIPADQLTSAKGITYFNRAKMAMHHGEYDIAEKALKEYAVYWRKAAKDTKSPDFQRTIDADIILSEGMLTAYKGNYESAISKAEENRKLLEPIKNPRKLEDFHRLIGKIYLLRTNYQEAINHYQQADLNNVEVKHELALAHEGAGNNGEAKKLFKEVAEWNFNSVEYALVRNDAIEKMKIMATK